MNFASGETLKKINVPIIDNGLFKGNQTFSISLTNPTGLAALGNPSTATVTILEDEPKPKVMVDGAGTGTPTLATVVEFTGNGASNKGSYPNGALALDSDGNLYGTTQQGGANGVGTVFKTTPGGTLTTLVNFTGNGASNKDRPGWYMQNHLP